MRLLYSLKSSSFFNTFDSDFFDGGTPENESDVVKQVGLDTYVIGMMFNMATMLC